MTVRRGFLRVRSKITAVTTKIIASAMAIFIAGTVFAAVPAGASDLSYSLVQEDKDYLLYENDSSGYQIMIDDMADLLSQDEEEALIPYMAKSLDGGFIMLVTTDYNEYGNAEKYAGNYYRTRIPEESGILFLIDMDTRELLFYSEGAYHRELGGSVMDIIGDNVYKYATNGDYFGCAKEAFIEIADVLEGKRISAPMKYVSNACLAILLALIINYFFARRISKAAKPSDAAIVNAVYNEFSFTNPNVRFLHESRKYSPRSSGSGGGGGGGGGGHSSGGHSF